MKKLDKKSYRNILVYVAVIIVMIVALISSFSILIVIGKRMDDSATSNLLNTTRVIRDSMESFLSKDLDSLEIIGNFWKSEEVLDSDKVEILRSAMGFDWLALTDENGNCIDFCEDSFNVNDMPCRDEWTPETKGYSNMYVGSSGRPEIMLWVPIYKEKAFIGTVFGSVILTKYYSANIFTFYDGLGRTYLFDGNDGSWILKSLGIDGTSNRQPDIYSLLLASGNDSENVESFKKAIEDRKAGTAEFVFNSEDSYLCFLPLYSSDNWYITTVIARTDLLRESTEVQQLIIIALVLSCVTLGVAAIFFSIWFARKTKADEIRYRDSLFVNISANLDSVFIIYEAAGKKSVYVSDNIKRILGYDKDWLSEDIGRLFDWCGITYNDKLRNDFLNGVIESATVAEVEIKDENIGKSRIIRIELIPAYLGQEIIVLTDITKDKEIQNSLIDAMQRAEYASAAKNEFFSAMSHDLRTPINGVVGMTAIAAANIDDKERVKDCLKKISDSSANLLELINEVLDMAQIESGKMELACKPLNLVQLLKETVNSGYPGAKNKNQKIKIHISDLEHEEVIGDASRLSRIAANLLSNAVKYTQEGGKIDVKLAEKECALQGYGCFELTVSDNGIGMSQEFQEKLFSPFEREEDVVLSHIQGTGLGMAIVKNIVELMMGKISVESEKGKGSTFTVEVNLLINEQQAATNDSLAGLRVLVVDGDADNSKEVAENLNKFGMIADWTDNSADALKKAKELRSNGSEYFAVIIDKDLPDTGGIETARCMLLDANEPKPTIVISSYGVFEFESEAKACGVYNFLSKPIYKSELLQKMSEIAFGKTYGLPANNVEPLFKGKRVLLAEDNEINREIAVELLSMIGIESDFVSNGADAVARFADSKIGEYDAILMDIQMPKMNGYQAAKEIRNMERTDARTIPIIAITADAFKKDVQMAYETGMDAHIAKPISISILSNVLASFLK